MLCTKLEFREISLDLLAPFETSFGRTTSRRIILCAAHDGERTGWGECTASEEPFYNEEFTDAAWSVLRDFVAPMVLGSRVERAAQVAAVVAPIRGHRMARAAVETALWDLEARRAGVPLWRHLGGAREVIPCGVSIGLQPSVEALREKVARELASGYRRIKIKIAPGRDVALVEDVRTHFGDVVLSVDANAAYSLSDMQVLRALDCFKLLMIEQPLAPGDLIDHAELQKQLETPICLDESVVDERTVRQAIEIDACRIVNIKLGRVGGHVEARRIAGRCQTARIPVWCGGMLESGIGRLHNAAMSSLEAFSLPGDVSDSRRYWARDVVAPRPTVEPDGTMRLSEAPGLGAEVDLDFVESITVRRHVASV